MTVYDRISVIVGVILIGIILLLILEIPSREFVFKPFGSPLTLSITSNWLASALLLGLSCTGTEAIMRTHPQVRRRIVRITFPTWILPGLTTLTLAQFLPQSPNLLYWTIGLIVGGGILAWLMLAYYRLFDLSAEQKAARSAQWIQGGLEIIAYTLALILFTLIYRTKLRSLVTATQVTFVAGMLALSILYREKCTPKQMGIYAGLIALVMGETMWALNYWQANALTVGVLLLLMFYVLVGIVQQHIRATLNRQVMLEFLSVIVLGIGIVIILGPQN